MFTNFDTFLLSLLNCLVLETFPEEPSPSNSTQLPLLHRQAWALEASLKHLPVPRNTWHQRQTQNGSFDPSPSKKGGSHFRGCVIGSLTQLCPLTKAISQETVGPSNSASCLPQQLGLMLMARTEEKVEVFSQDDSPAPNSPALTNSQAVNCFRAVFRPIIKSYLP